MKKSFWILRAIIGIAALGALFYKIDISQVMSTIAMINPVTIILLASLPAITLLVTTLNLHILFNASGERISYSQLLKKNMFSRAASFFLPGKVGELSLIYFLKERVGYGISTSILVIDKIITFIILTGFASYGFFIFFENDLAYRLLSFLILGIITLTLILKIKKIRKIIRIKVLRKHAPLLTGFGKTLDYITKQGKGAIVLNLFLTFLLWTFLGLAVYFIFTQFGENPGALNTIVIHATGVLVALIPLSISGIGIRESAVVYLFNTMGTQPAVAASVYLLTLFFTYAFATSILIFLKPPFPKKKNKKTKK